MFEAVFKIFRVTLLTLTSFIASITILIYNLQIVEGNESMNQEDRIIPRKVLFGNPDKASVTISPDGKNIAYLAPLDGVLNIYISDSNSWNDAKPITFDKKRGIRQYFWSYDNENIVYLQDSNGDENWQVFIVNILTKESKRLTPFDKTNVRISEVSNKVKDKIVVGINNRKPEFHDIYILNLKTGALELLYENNKYGDVILDDEYNIRFLVKQSEEGGMNYFIYNTDAKEELLIEVSINDVLTTTILGFDKSLDNIYLLDSRGRDTGALFTMNIKDRSKRLIYSHTNADINGVLGHPTEKYVQAVYWEYAKPEYKVLDNDLAKDFDYITSQIGYDFEVASRSLDSKIWIITRLSDDKPVEYFIYNKPEKKLTKMFSNRKELEGYKLAKMYPVIIESRDKMKLVSYLTLPSNIKHINQDIENYVGPKIPLILYVHGGPSARDSWGLNTVHQWLANRGYAVLSVNYRGSIGFGKSFIGAGNGEWAAKMHDDLIDAANWAVKKGVTDSDKIGIMGASYGGYATLVGLTITPDFFVCGVDIVGPSSLITLLESLPPYWKPFIKRFKVMLGADAETEEGKAILRKKSPLFFVDQIKKPLLIGQGANDPRVKQAESDQIVQSMSDKNIPVTYVLYPDEGHGFARPENRTSFFGITEIFLAHCFNNTRFEEMTKNDFMNSTADIRHGKEFISQGLPK